MNRTQLYESLNRLFDDNELQTLCFKLGIDYESLSGNNKPAKVRELIEYCERIGKTNLLINVVKEERPNFVSDLSTSKKTDTKKEGEVKKVSGEMKVAIIGGVFTLLATILGIFLPRFLSSKIDDPVVPIPTQIPMTSTTISLSPAVCVPSLISPHTNAILDNGRADGSDNIVWDFDWSDCLGASEYHLYVIGSNATNPVIDNSTITSSSYHKAGAGSHIPVTSMGRTDSIGLGRLGQE